jgi:hypothetical protein
MAITACDPINNELLFQTPLMTTLKTHSIEVTNEFSGSSVRFDED